MEEKEVADEEKDYSLKQAREAVGAATQRVDGKARAMKVRRRSMWLRLNREASGAGV
jgi:hypothetical protein